MRPDDRAPAVPAPAPVNGATLAARAHLGAAKELQAVGRNADARKYLEAAARNTRAHNSMTPMVSNSKGDSNFGGLAEGASATALIELAKEDIGNGRYKEAFERLQTASQAKPTNAERRVINDLMLKILPHLDRGRPPQNPPPRMTVSGALIEAAKKQIANKEYRLANQTLNRAAQSRPNAEEKRQIEALLEQIAKEMR
jgi:Flp pilus assembly protein TadD